MIPKTYTVLLAAFFLTLSSVAQAASPPLGTKVNRFQLVARALKHPGLYSAAINYMDEVSFPKNDVLTCYWNASNDGNTITLTNILPGTTRTIVFTRSAKSEWKVSEPTSPMV